MTYALGRRVESYDMPTVRAHRPRRRARHDYRISSFVQGVVKSQAFRMMKPTLDRRDHRGRRPHASSDP